MESHSLWRDTLHLRNIKNGLFPVSNDLTEFDVPPYVHSPSPGSIWGWDGFLVLGIAGGEDEGTGNRMYSKIILNLN